MDTKLKTAKGDEEKVRFEFGENWSAFLQLLNESRIKSAEESLKDMLGTDSLAGKYFLDIGSGSGLFSLAAKKLGANVISFDFDEVSVKCTQYLKEKFYSGDNTWQVAQGSVLDSIFMNTIPTVDYVYSWGVLHHTGNMLLAMENACKMAKPGGVICVALYRKTVLDGFWKWFKKMYSQSGKRTQSFYQR
jgi:2-polyprenyl-6-hydroxyphenyl methylase/3-demethylubiquinone-9 3-methyltransferase